MKLGILSFSVALLMACSGGGTTAVTNTLPTTVTALSTPKDQVQERDSQNSAAVPVQVAYYLPNNKLVSSHAFSHAMSQSDATRKLQYISVSNSSISITVTPVGGSGTTYGPTSCTTVSCAVSFTALPGPNMLAFTLTDASSNVLSTFSTMVIVKPLSLNTFNFSANPVVHSVALQLGSTSVNGGTKQDIALSVDAKDVDGNTIIGSANYVDSNGQPLALLLHVNNNQAGGSGSLTFQGPTRITAPMQAQSYVHYDGGWLASATISVTSTSSVLASFTPSTLTTVPSEATGYTVPTTNAGVVGITTGPDGNIWFTEYAANKIGRLTLNGTFTEFVVPTANSNPTFIMNGPDGNLWFPEYNTNKIARITPNGTFSEFTVPTANSHPLSLIQGSDGNIWFTEYSGPKVGRITHSGVLTEFSDSLSMPAPYIMTLGTDGNIWYTETTSYITRLTPSGSTTFYTIPTSASTPYGIITGADGNFWFAEFDGNKIGRLTLSGSFTEYPIPTANSGPIALAVGVDGNVWFVEYKVNNLGRITPSGVMTEFPIPMAARDITLGPDGNLWYVVQGSNEVGKFVL